MDGRTCRELLSSYLLLSLHYPPPLLPLLSALLSREKKIDEMNSKRSEIIISTIDRERVRVRGMNMARRMLNNYYVQCRL